jgi:hypothetical protein
MHLLPSVTIQPNLELKTRPKQPLGSLLLVIALPGRFVRYKENEGSRLRCNFISTTLLRISLAIELYHPLDGITNPNYKFLCFETTNFLQRENGTSF